MPPLKEDLKEARERLSAWWRGERTDLLPLITRGRRAKPAWNALKPAVPVNLNERWLDPGFRTAAAEYELVNTWWGGEALPHVDMMIGPGSLALALGSQPKLDEDTVWFEPWIDDPEAVTALEFNAAAPAWRAQMALVETAVKRADGRYIVTIPDLIEGLDILASLRGSEALLTDLADRPAWVHARQAELLDHYFTAYDRIYNLVKDAEGASQFAAFGVWGPGRMAKLQCDMSAMLGPDMFREFVAPYLAHQCERLDYTCYHLDGPQAVKHLDALLEIPRLGGIQWTPGAGQPTAGDPVWYPLWRRVLDGGKRVFAVGMNPKHVAGFAKTFGAERTMVGTWRLKSEHDARMVLSAAGRFS